MVMGALTLVFISVLVLWPIRFVFRSLSVCAPRGPAAQAPARFSAFSLAARGTALAACTLALWFEAAFASASWRLKPFADFYGIPAPLKHILWNLPVLALFAAALVFFSLEAWRRRMWHPAERWHYLLVAIAVGLFLYTFYSRHLLVM